MMRALSYLRVSMVALTMLPAVAPGEDAPPPVGAPRSGQGDVAVTIYSNDVALVQDTRRLNLPAGVSRQDFPDVSTQIRPATVRLSAAGTDIVEQNYDYDLLSPAALMEKAVGQEITLVRTNPATGAETRERAKVLASNDGVVLQIGSRIEVLRDDGLPVRAVFDRVPESLRARPTLSVTLSYLTGGLRWVADYVALFDEAKGALDVQGWITLTNQGSTSFTNADTVLVAGSPGATPDDDRYSRPSRPFRPGSNPGTETATRARVGDYYLYPLAERTTIAANSQKQVSFLSVDAVPAKRGYGFVNPWLGASDDPRSVSSILTFSSSRSGGLGDALPAGTVRVYMRDAKGQPQFTGESAIPHTPMGSSLALVTGEAFDVKVAPTVVKRERIDANEWRSSYRYRIRTSRGYDETVSVDSSVELYRTTMRYTLTNAKPTPVTVDVVQAGLDNDWQDTRVPSETLPGEQRSADERVWHVPVPANGTATLTVQFDTRY